MTWWLSLAVRKGQQPPWMSARGIGGLRSPAARCRWPRVRRASPASSGSSQSRRTRRVRRTRRRVPRRGLARLQLSGLRILRRTGLAGTPAPCPRNRQPRIGSSVNGAAPRHGTSSTLTPWSPAADSPGAGCRNSPPAETPASIFEFSPTCSQSSTSIRTPSSRLTAESRADPADARAFRRMAGRTAAHAGSDWRVVCNLARRRPRSCCG
jgi:hypothetical protein